LRAPQLLMLCKSKFRKWKRVAKEFGAFPEKAALEQNPPRSEQTRGVPTADKQAKAEGSLTLEAVARGAGFKHVVDLAARADRALQIRLAASRREASSERALRLGAGLVARVDWEDDAMPRTREERDFARRRTVLCRFGKDCKAPHGAKSAMTLAHAPEELRPLPAWGWRMMLCDERRCVDRRECQFAHGPEELRAPR
jgi:hypothetical protein